MKLDEEIKKAVNEINTKYFSNAMKPKDPNLEVAKVLQLIKLSPT